MKILYFKNYIHHKNDVSLKNYKNIEFFTLENAHENYLDLIDLNNFDCVYSPSTPINVSKYPNTKFLFGPHFSAFPESKHIKMIESNNSIYIQPSEWVKDLWRNNYICDNIRIESLPFGVEVDKFTPSKKINDRNNIFVYYKGRKPEEFQQVMNFLSQFNLNIKVFNYSETYSEEEYLRYLRDSKYGIWVGGYESQGFALQEALSCDVPLLVWNMTSMNQYYGYNLPDIPSTTIPYWDNRCGEFFNTISELNSKFDKFISNLQNYRPREYILENLSIEQCEKKFIDIINKI